MSQSYYVKRLDESIKLNKKYNIKKTLHKDYMDCVLTINQNNGTSGILFEGLYLFKGVYKFSFELVAITNSQYFMHGPNETKNSHRIYFDNGANEIELNIKDHDFYKLGILITNPITGSVHKINNLKLEYVSRSCCNFISIINNKNLKYVNLPLNLGKYYKNMENFHGLLKYTSDTINTNSLFITNGNPDNIIKKHKGSYSELDISLMTASNDVILDRTMM